MHEGVHSERAADRRQPMRERGIVPDAGRRGRRYGVKSNCPPWPRIEKEAPRAPRWAHVPTALQLSTRLSGAASDRKHVVWASLAPSGTHSTCNGCPHSAPLGPSGLCSVRCNPTALFLRLDAVRASSDLVLLKSPAWRLLWAVTLLFLWPFLHVGL